jgi:Helicase conserved C-terminal domain/DEAD/DEAH box helicase
MIQYRSSPPSSPSRRAPVPLNTPHPMGFSSGRRSLQPADLNHRAPSLPSGDVPDSLAHTLFAHGGYGQLPPHGQLGGRGATVAYAPHPPYQPHPSYPTPTQPTPSQPTPLRWWPESPNTYASVLRHGVPPSAQGYVGLASTPHASLDLRNLPPAHDFDYPHVAHVRGRPVHHGSVANTRLPVAHREYAESFVTPAHQSTGRHPNITFYGSLPAVGWTEFSNDDHPPYSAQLASARPIASQIESCGTFLSHHGELGDLALPPNCSVPPAPHSIGLVSVDHLTSDFAPSPLFSFFIISPFGLRCKKCGSPVTSNDVRTLQCHVNQCKSLREFTGGRHFSLADVRLFKDQFNRSNNDRLKAAGPSHFITDDTVLGDQCSCGRSFALRTTFLGHLHDNPSHEDRGKVPLLRSICGRAVSQAQVDELWSHYAPRNADPVVAPAVQPAASFNRQRPPDSHPGSYATTAASQRFANDMSLDVGSQEEGGRNNMSLETADGLLLDLSDDESCIVLGGRMADAPSLPVRVVHLSDRLRNSARNRSALNDVVGNMSFETSTVAAALDESGAAEDSDTFTEDSITSTHLRAAQAYYNFQRTHDFVERSLIDATNREDPTKYLALVHGWAIEIAEETALVPSLCALVHMINRPADPDEEAGLSRLEDVVPTWAKSAAPTVSDVPPPLRHVLNNWTEASKHGSDTVVNPAFMVRHNDDSFMKPLRQFLRFAWRFPTSLFDRVRSYVEASHDPTRLAMLISDFLLVDILENNALDGDTYSAFVKCLLARSCHDRRSQQSQATSAPTDVKLLACGTISSYISTDLAMCKAAIILKIRNEKLGASTPRLQVSILARHRYSLSPKELVDTATSSVTFTKMASVIRTLREMDASKPRIPKSITKASGDVVVAGKHHFPYSSWSKMIPLFCDAWTALLCEFLPTSDWTYFLDPDATIAVVKTRDTFDVSVCQNNGEEKKLADVPVSHPASYSSKLDRLTAYGRLAFDGFGVGAARGTEVNRIPMDHVNWVTGNIFYQVVVIKTARYTRAGSSRTVQHQLPSDVSRLFLLYRHILEKIVNSVLEDAFPPPTTESCISIAVKELFCLDSQPSLRDVRQFFSSIANMTNVTAGLAADELTAEDSLAESFGHSAMTHAKNYATGMADSPDRQARRWHTSLGFVEPAQRDRTKISQMDLARAVTRRFGRGAAYKSTEQRDMVLKSARRSGHMVVNLPCGAGKSQAWELPLIAAAISGKKLGAIVVVEPYLFLAKTMEQSAFNAFEAVGLGQQIRVKRFDTAELTTYDVPDFLSNPAFLPSLIIMTVDGIAKFQKHHPAVLEQWKEQRPIHRVYVDEAHTIYSEISFRPAYESLRNVRLWGPVTLLSATLPTSLHASVCSYLHISSFADFNQKVDVVGECRPYTGGYEHGFEFNVRRSKDYVEATIDSAELALGVPYTGDRPTVHIICSTKDEAKKITERLSASFKVGLVTGDVEPDALDPIAEDWSKGNLEVLVTTTAGLVGNECSQCRHVIICGYIYDLASLVQALGRLREPQRTRIGTISQHIPVDPPPTNLIENNNDMKEKLVALRLILEKQALTDYSVVFTISGLNNWVEMPGCRFKALSSCFRAWSCDPCGVCDYCRKAIDHSSTSSPDLLPAEVIPNYKSREAAEMAIAELSRVCFACFNSTCDGDERKDCVAGLCYKCGSRHHYTNDCNFSYEQYQALFCYECLDCRERPGYLPHWDPTVCPLKRRIRRAFIALYHDQRSGMKFPPRPRNMSHDEYTRMLDADYVDGYRRMVNQWLASTESFYLALEKAHTWHNKVLTEKMFGGPDH